MYSAYFSHFQDSGQSRSTSVSECNSINHTTDQMKDLGVGENTKSTETTGSDKLVDEIAEDSTKQASSDADIDKKNQPQSETTETKEIKRVGDGDTLLTSSLQEGLTDSEDDESKSDDDDDEDGWITPSNIASIKQAIGEPEMQRACVHVACLTTDFAMQVHK